MYACTHTHMHTHTHKHTHIHTQTQTHTHTHTHTQNNQWQSRLKRIPEYYSQEIIIRFDDIIKYQRSRVLVIRRNEIIARWVRAGNVVRGTKSGFWYIKLK